MTITPRLRKEVEALVGGVILARLIVTLLGIRENLFAAPLSSIGAVLLFFACRGFVLSLHDRWARGEETNRHEVEPAPSEKKA